MYFKVNTPGRPVNLAIGYNLVHSFDYFLITLKIGYIGEDGMDYHVNDWSRQLVMLVLIKSRDINLFTLTIIIVGYGLAKETDLIKLATPISNSYSTKLTRLAFYYLVVATR